MQEDVFPAAEKILSDIENVLKKDPNLVSFEIIPAEDNKNKSPVFHDENSLGLASWSVQPLFCYAYNRLLDLRQNKHRREDPGTVSRWLLGALLLNPDISTFWNTKRELIKNGRLDPMQELRFASIVLYYKSKCFEAFAYRRWLVKFMLLESNQPSGNVDSILRDEIKVATMAADRYANNSHAWSHREHAVGLFEALAPDDVHPLLQKEWEDSSNWCNRHVSDYSGFAYRQFLLKKLLLLYRRNAEEGTLSPEKIAKRREFIFEFAKTGSRGCNDVFLLFDGSSVEVLDLMHGSEHEKRVSDYEQTLINLSYWTEECTLNEDLINSFPGHEALWYHRRFLAYSLLALLASYKKYSSYKFENFNPCQGIRPRIEKSKTAGDPSISKGLLEVAFRNHNQDVIALAKRSGHHQNSLAEKFIKYLTYIDLEP